MCRRLQRAPTCLLCLAYDNSTELRWRAYVMIRILERKALSRRMCVHAKAIAGEYWPAYAYKTQKTILQPATNMQPAAGTGKQTRARAWNSAQPQLTQVHGHQRRMSTCRVEDIQACNGIVHRRSDHVASECSDSHVGGLERHRHVVLCSRRGRRGRETISQSQ
jgi:hypothetical protein